MTIGTNYICPDNRIRQDVILAAAEGLPFQSTLLSSISDKLTDMGVELARYTYNYYQIGASNNKDNNAGINYYGAMVEVCSTEGQNIQTIPTHNSLRAVSLRFILRDCAVRVSPDYTGESLSTYTNRVLTDQSIRQMEAWGYQGYAGTQLGSVSGLNGLKDIGTEKVPGVVTPIDPTDYTAFCTYLTEGINAVRAGDTIGNQYSRGDVDVHISRDIVDKINCSLVAGTSVSYYNNILNGILSDVRGVYVSDTISNSIYFVNHAKVFAIHTPILTERPENPIACQGGFIYEYYGGTVSFGNTGPTPVIYGENVLDLS